MSIRLILLLTGFLLLSGCKKTIDRIKEDLIIDLMVDGQWKVSQFKIDNTDQLSFFSPYTFKYHRNKTVDAINMGTTAYTGQWDGDIESRTTWADFGSAPAPIELLNGTWQVESNTSNYVILTQASATGNKHMRLDKI